jgi:hypothetical protein
MQRDSTGTLAAQSASSEQGQPYLLLHSGTSELSKSGLLSPFLESLSVLNADMGDKKGSNAVRNLGRRNH